MQEFLYAVKSNQMKQALSIEVKSKKTSLNDQVSISCFNFLVAKIIAYCLTMLFFKEGKNLS